ncbi:unnamed protein product [Sphagnum balticum]
MFKSLKKKPEKAKEAIDFKLKFHATRVPLQGWEKLVISVVSLETRKAVAKTARAVVKNGNCQWQDPIVESTRLQLNQTTNEYEEKFYKLVVSSGSSRAGILGEALINLGEFADFNHPAQRALPLKNCNSGTVLHNRLEERSQERNISQSTLRYSGSSFDSLEVPSTPGTNSPLAQSPHGSLQGYRGGGGASQEPRSPLSPNKQNHRRTLSSSAAPIVPIRSGWHEDHQSRQAGGGRSRGLVLSPSQLQGEDALRAALAAAQSTIEDLQMEAETAQRHADKLGVDVERLNRKLEVQILSGKEMGMEMSALVAERDQLKDEVERLLLAKQTSQEQELDAGNARFAMEEARRSVKELNEEIMFEKETTKNLNLQLRKMQDANMELVLEIEELEKALEQQQEENGIKKTHESPEASFQASSGDDNTPVATVTERKWHERLAEKEDENKDLQAKIASLELLLSQRHPKAAFTPKETDDAFVQSLQGMVKVLQQDVEELEAESNGLTDEIRVLKSRLEISNQELKAALEAELADFEKVRLQMADHISELEMQLESTTGECELQQQEASVLKNQVVSLVSEKEKLQSMLEQEVQQHRDVLLKLESELGAALEELETYKSTQLHLEERVGQLTGEVTVHVEANEELQKRAIAMEESLQRTMEQVEQLTGDVSSHVEAKEGLQKGVVDLEESLQRALEQVEQLTGQVSYHLEAKQGLQKRTVELEASLQRAIGEVEQLTGEVSGQMEAKEALQKHIGELEENLEGAVQELEHLRGEVSHYEEANVGLQRHVEELEESLQKAVKGLATVAALEAQVTQLQSAYDEQGVRYNSEFERLTQLMEAERQKAEEALQQMSRENATAAEILQKNRIGLEYQLTTANAELASFQEKHVTLQRQLEMQKFFVKEKQKNVVQGEVTFVNIEQPSFIALSLSPHMDCTDSKGVGSSALASHFATAMQLPASAVVHSSAGQDQELKIDTCALSSSSSTSKSEPNMQQGIGNVDQLIELQKRTKSLEAELRDMQDRYSSMSLRFAEVEAQREELVMVDRNLRSTRR